jgi:Ca2+-binding RTX toxin-like protein
VGGIDRLSGGSGNDILTGGAGADALIGGNGVDTASYADSGGGVNVNLGTNVATGGAAEGDTFSSIEIVIGSKFGDKLTGGNGNDDLRGRAGDDVITGGRGSDQLTGGAGADKFAFKDARFGRDTITDFENGTDLIDLRGSGLTSASFVISNFEGDTILTLLSNPVFAIIIEGVKASTIDAGDFLV